MNKYPLLVIFFVFSFSLDAGWLDRKAEGWPWYEDRKIEEKKEVPKKQSSSQKLAQAKKELEEKLADAILEPTQENIVAYIKLQKKWLDRSSKFSEEWSKILLDLPQLDPTIGFPVSHYGRQVYRRIDNEKKQERISELSQDYALIFFYEGESKVSQAFSLVVQEFGKKYDWEIAGVSCDGTMIKGFQINRVDNALSEQFGINVFPALFAVTPNKQEAVPIAYGLVSFDKIENNLLLRFSKKKENFND